MQLVAALVARTQKDKQLPDNNQQILRLTRKRDPQRAAPRNDTLLHCDKRKARHSTPWQTVQRADEQTELTIRLEYNH